MSKGLTVMLGHCFNLATPDVQPQHDSEAGLLRLAHHVARNLSAK